MVEEARLGATACEEAGWKRLPPKPPSPAVVVAMDGTVVPPAPIKEKVGFEAAVVVLAAPNEGNPPVVGCAFEEPNPPPAGVEPNVAPNPPVAGVEPNPPVPGAEPNPPVVACVAPNPPVGAAVAVGAEPNPKAG